MSVFAAIVRAKIPGELPIDEVGEKTKAKIIRSKKYDIHDLTPTSIKREQAPVAVCSLVIFIPHYSDIKGVIERHWQTLSCFPFVCAHRK
ncbi:hypothetical protein GCM10020370_42880 [Paenibacillus hodogayensis]